MRRRSFFSLLGLAGALIALCLPATSSAQFQFAFEFGGPGTGPPGELSSTADGVAVDSDGNVWVVDRFVSRLVKYDYNGQFIASVNAPIGGGGSFSNPTDIAADRKGHVFVLDQGNVRVVELSNSGRFQRAFGQNGELADRLSTPLGLAVSASGRIFVTDPGHARIAVYRSNGTVDRFITTIANPNRISIPPNVAGSPSLYVTERGNVARLSWRGALQRTVVASTGSAQGVAFNQADNRVYVADFGGSVLKAFSSDLGTVATINSAGTGAGQTNGPGGVAADCRGNVYLVDGAVPGAGGLPGGSKVVKFGDPAAKPPPCTAPAGPPSGLDTQVNEIEVTQGVQNLQPYTATDAPSGPRTRTFGAPEVDMRAGGKTVVRVYANLRAGDAGGAGNVPATLEGIRPGGRSLGTITPDAGPAVLRIGDSVTDMAERLDPAGAYTFTLPESWSLIGKLDLIARVNPAGLDCDDACQRRSTFRLNGVKFRETIRGCSVRTGGGRPRPACDSRYGVEVWPVALLNRGAYPIMNGSPLTDPGPAFDMARLLTPANLVVSPWMGEIDVSGIENGSSITIEECFLGIELGILCDDDTFQLDLGTPAQQAQTRQYLEGALFEKIERFKEDRNIGDSAIIETLRGRPGARNDGVLPGAMRGKYLENQEDREDSGGRGYADVARPIGTVAHELQHALGRRHAGAKASCYPSAKQIGEPWPEPTDSGALIGTGLDLRPGSGGFRGPYRIISPGVFGLSSPLGDLMSYCIPGENQIWISTVGWNQILNYRGISPSPARATAHVAQTSSGPLIRVTAVELSDGRLAITGTQPTRGRTASPDASAPYQLQARDAQGNILSTSPASAQDSTDSGAVVILGSVPRPAGTAQVVVAHGTRAARAQKSAHAPRVKLLSPRRGKVKAKKVPIRWRATDADKDALTTTIDFSANGGRSWRTLFVGAASGSHKLPMALLARSRNARLRVRADDGFSEASAVSTRLSVTGPKPLVRILDPVNRQRMRADAPLRLSARAFGDFGKPLGIRAVRWFDGRHKLGVGTALTLSGLRAGRHTIRAVARAGGRTGSASVKITVRAVKPAFLALDVPARVSRRARKMRLRVASTVATRLTIGRKRFAVGQRARRVTVKVKPGKSALKLKLRLGSGRLSTSRKVTIVRR